MPRVYICMLPTLEVHQNTQKMLQLRNRHEENMVGGETPQRPSWRLLSVRPRVSERRCCDADLVVLVANVDIKAIVDVGAIVKLRGLVDIFGFIGVSV